MIEFMHNVVSSFHILYCGIYISHIQLYTTHYKCEEKSGECESEYNNYGAICRQRKANNRKWDDIAY